MTTYPTPARDSRPEPRELNLSFPADTNQIAPVVDQVVELARPAAGESGAEMNVALALTEALANAVKHGSKNDPSKIVSCSASLNGDGILDLVVRDSGPGFDPDKVPDPRFGDGLSADHGRGIYLIRELMDEVWYEHHGTELHMKKKL
jgi:serine/threonine-protein kinase RsbW